MDDLKDLKSKAVTASIWAIIEKFSLQIVQFVVGVVLARLLEPKDYGLIALTAIFTSLSSAIIDGGFEKTLIRAKELRPIQISSVFYVNMFLGAALTAALFFSAGPVAHFFNEPGLAPVLRVVSFGLLLNALTQVQRVLLMKELKFKKISLAQIISSLTSGVVGIIMAYRGFGVWSLVFSGLAFQVVTAIFFWVRSDWYPETRFSYSAIREMLPYGSGILIVSILFFFMLQFNTFIIGKLFNETELGYFNRGGRFPDLLVSIIQSIVIKMAFPLFVKVREDNTQLEKVLRKTTQLVAFICFPLLALLLVNASDITITVFTAKWSSSIVFMELFCLITLFEPFIVIYRELILAQGKSKLMMHIFLATSAGEIILILLLARYGITFIIIASIISKAIQYFIYMAASSGVTHISRKAQLRWISPYLLAAILMGLLVEGMGYLLAGSGIMMLPGLILKSLTGILVYLLLARLFRLNELSFITTLWQEFEKRILFRLKKRNLSIKKI